MYKRFTIPNILNEYKGVGISHKHVPAYFTN